jgi:integrase
MWRKRVTLSDGRSHDIYGKTQKEVRQKVQDIIKKDFVAPVPKRDTLERFANEWLTVKTANLSYSSTCVYTNALNNHILPYFGKHTPLNKIKPMDVRAFMASVAPLSHSSQHKLLSTLSQIMQTAFINDFIPKNPCLGVKAGGEKPKPKVPLTTEQQQALVAAVRGTRVELFVLLCLYAGLRREEALGLLWESVNLKGTPYITVRHTVTFEGSRSVHSEKLKSKAAYRSIPTPKILTDALVAASKDAKSPFVVPAAVTGKQISGRSFSRLWDIVENSTGGQFHLTPHILRHTYITELCASGMDIKKIQYLAGHEDVTMTLRVYSHVKANAPSELAAIIESVFS